MLITPRRQVTRSWSLALLPHEHYLHLWLVLLLVTLPAVSPCGRTPCSAPAVARAKPRVLDLKQATPHLGKRTNNGVHNQNEIVPAANSESWLISLLACTVRVLLNLHTLTTPPPSPVASTLDLRMIIISATYMMRYYLAHTVLGCIEDYK